MFAPSTNGKTVVIMIFEGFKYWDILNSAGMVRNTIKTIGMKLLEKNNDPSTTFEFIVRVCSNRAFLTKIKVCPISAFLKLLQYIHRQNSFEFF